MKQFFLMMLLLLLMSCSTSKGRTLKSTVSDIITDETPESEVSEQKQLNHQLTFYYGGTLSEVIERAEEEKKLVFVDFTAAWCAPCKLMEEEVYTHRSVYELYNLNFINYRIDVDKDNGPNIAFLYEVKTLPTLLFLDSRGRVVHRYTGSLGISGMIDLANEIILKDTMK